MAKVSYEQILLILAIIFLPINNFSVKLPLVGGAVSKGFIFIGFIVLIYDFFIKKNQLDEFERLCLYYLLACYLWQCLCTIIGIQEYEYNEMLYLEQMDKLRYLLQFLWRNGWSINDISAIKIWLTLRCFKDCAFNVLFSYGIVLWIYHIYKNIQLKPIKISTVITHVIASVSILCVVLISYSIFEIGYLRGNQFCSDIIVKINPLLYNVGEYQGWWPPLLWKNQLRSIFAEPSHFGIVGVLIVPMLFYGILKFKTKLSIITYSVFVMMLFMTKARTALVLFIIQGVLLLLYVVVLNPDYTKKIFNIVFVSVFSFFVALYLMTGFKTVSNDSNIQVDNAIQMTVLYVNDNVISVIGNKRSNKARFASVSAALKTGAQHPLFGVGGGLSGAYMNANFTDVDLANDEVRNKWVFNMFEKGVLKSSIPILNQLANEVVHYGIPGLLMYLLPVFFIFHKLSRLIVNGLDVEHACLLIAYIGTLVAMLGDGSFLTYYILTGLIITSLFSAKKGDNRIYEIM